VGAAVEGDYEEELTKRTLTYRYAGRWGSFSSEGDSSAESESKTVFQLHIGGQPGQVDRRHRVRPSKCRSRAVSDMCGSARDRVLRHDLSDFAVTTFIRTRSGHP